MRLYFLLLLWAFTISLSAQNYCVEYQHSTLFNQTVTKTSHLYFNPTEWIYYQLDNFIPQDSNRFDGENYVSLVERSDSCITNYRSITDNCFLDEEYIFLDKKIIRGELVKPNWKIMTDTMQVINGYACYLAETFVCGRNFTAWFTTDIPVNCGPWKLWGLPGLILSAYSDDGVITINLTSLKKTDTVIMKPQPKVTLTVEEFKSEFNKRVKKINRFIQSFDTGERNMETSGSVYIFMADKSLVQE